ncbi:MAG: hypothetical protein COU33_02735 [Candidatus Magasanikbacteria bacterium CG10_big_fil_rev_8_21_14_0_10_43_6]|uniref:Uncharacterized protein n=1 Tax=Candidatus Magasanikbacteria bacterium CG10_big_fil_rev_8_21_14_0_10_43_6 TaxID=1974650 RepID=A0A2M6W168_9BACT|nr:MAG: hypothetical protein COU33_02735 [Candidatus Magasanikbacteria bacterium CG10_big_fil_rev_8_21_14_0_10_43_6]
MARVVHFNEGHLDPRYGYSGFARVCFEKCGSGPFLLLAVVASSADLPADVDPQGLTFPLAQIERISDKMTFYVPQVMLTS